MTIATKPYCVFIILVVTAAMTASAQIQTETYQGHQVAAHQVLAKLRDTSNPVLNQILQLVGGDSIHGLGNSLGVFAIHAPNASVQALIAILQNHPTVEFVEPDYIVHPVTTPNDPNFSAEWGLLNTGTPGADIGATSAWSISTGSTANVVGVVDTGVDYTHPDLAANIWSAPAAFTVNLSWGQITCPAGSHGYNALTRSCDPKDDNSHGTHVSGTIGAIGNNGLGVAGVNWTTRIMGLKFMDSTGNGTTSGAIDAIEFAIQTKAAFGNSGTPVNVRVLSNSWGGSGNSQSLLAEIQKANSNEMLFVVAAGNSATNDDTTPSYPASYTGPNIITVAATTNTDALASFSSYGPTTVALGAPGYNILSTLPNASYGYYSGTSMATPHVSGAAMLILSACSLNTASLKSTILSNVDVIPALSGKTSTGGRLNVNKAIRSCASVVSQAPTPLRLVTVPPCRIMDTRAGSGFSGAFGAPSLAGGTTRDIPIPQSVCNIPSAAAAYSLNVTVVPHGGLNYLSIWPTGQASGVSTLNSRDGRILANAAIVGAGTNGSLTVFVSDDSDVIIDINGYFASGANGGNLAFYPVTPCRIADTRGGFTGAFGPPYIAGTTSRSLPVPSSTCGIPTTAQAYSLNVTVSPHGPLGYLTMWPTGQSQPAVSTLNASDGSLVANAAIVPAGTGGAISVFASNDTDVILDINGYFAPPGSAGAESFYTVAPCRLADTRGNGFTGAFGAPGLAGNTSRSFPVPSSACNIPSSAQAYSLNVTVLPPGQLGYLTAWPAGIAQPYVSTLNSPLGKVLANAAIVPAGTNGAVSIFVTDTTDLILDINGYFGQ